jgi:serine/threonine protein kinase
MTGVIDPPAAPAAGAVLGDRYRLESLVGRGGYATVYRAVDERLERTVALKIFAAAAADGSDSARVASETRVLASLTHPSLVTLFDARLDEEPPFLVMELIDGPTLTQRLAEGPVDPATAATFATHLAEALHVIHARGIVHRDMKPSNVLLRPAPLPFEPPRATLADFGIAYLIDSARVTATGTLIGTAAYLSPEQARGEPPAPAADIYSLGLVLLEALTGQRAYAQNTPHEALVARLVRSPEIPPTLPRGWRDLLSAMTAMDPAERPDAHAVQRAAMRLQSDTETLQTDPAGITMPETAVTPASSAPEPPTERLRPETGTRVLPDAATAAAAPKTRRRAWWIGAAAVVAAAVIAIIVALVVIPSGAPAPDPTLPALPEPLGEHLRQLLEQVQP